MRSLITINEFRKALQSDRNMVEQRMAAGEIALRHSFVAEVKAAEDGVRAFDFTISTDSVDRQGDTIAVDGWKLDSYRKNPVVLWAHDYSMLPVARAENVRVEDGRLKSSAVFTAAGLAPFNDMVFEMITGGFLSATSVGFMPLKWAWTESADRIGIDFIEQELLEYSIVPVPANAEALIEIGQRSAPTVPQETNEPWAREIARRRTAIRRASAR